MACVLMIASVASMIDQFNRPNIRLIQEMGYEVHVACNFRQGNTCSRERVNRLWADMQDMHVVCHQWDCPRNVYPPGACRLAYRQLLYLTQRYSYVWMHCQSPVGAALARIVAHQRGIRVVYTAHGFHFYQGAPLKNWLLYYPAEKLLAHWTHLLVTINTEDYQFAARHLAVDVRYTPGIGVDTAYFQKKEPQQTAFRKAYGIPKDARVLLSVGELNGGKNHAMVFDVLAGLSRTDVYYIICGQGILHTKLRAYARKLGISSHVRMPGYQEDILRFYRNADIFVFPSRREGMPVALIEAMAAGLPCIASDIRGNHELIGPPGPGTKAGGALFSPNHPGQLKDALSAMLDDARLRQRCGEYNRKKAASYSRFVVEKQMRRIYKEMG